MMNKMKKFEDVMELLWKKVDPEHLECGDHIYAYRRYGSYSHHGIYVGGGRVIHFNVTEGKKGRLPPSRAEPETSPACLECGYQKNTGRGGVIKTCLNCFRRDRKKLHSIHYFKYGAPRFGFRLKNRGTCSTLPYTRSPEEVVKIAHELLERNGFGEYHLASNNCEHFATYCQTGQRESTQTAFIKPGLKKYEGVGGRLVKLKK